MPRVIDLRREMPGGNSRRDVSRITKIARHHSATVTGDAKSFANYHINNLKWSTSGYHEVILRNGDVQLCYNANVITNGVGNHNTNTYHICVVGNGSFTEAQERAFEERARFNMQTFGLSANDVIGHNEFPGHQSNACPGLNMNTVRNRLRNTGLSTVLRRGDRGNEVQNLQRDLLAVGEKLPRFGVDGDFGAETEQAVMAFQARHNLTVDGIAGPQTLGKLSAVIAALPKEEPKEEEFEMLENAVVINSFADFPAAEQVANRHRAPIFLRSFARGEFAKTVFVVGGSADGIKGNVVNLSGSNRFETAQNVGRHLGSL